VTSEPVTQSLNRHCITRALFSSNPLENADHDKDSNAVLLDGAAAGPIRIGAEALESVPYVMHNSDNDDEGKRAKMLHPS